MQNKLKSLFKRDKDSIDTERTEKTLMTTLFRIPVMLVIVSITVLAFGMALRTDKIMRNSLEYDSETLIYNIAARLEDNATSLEALEGSLTDEMNLVFDHMVIDDEKLDNDYLIEAARILGVDEINYYDSSTVIRYSTDPNNIGIQSEPNHPVTIFQQTGDDRMIERLRLDTDGLNEEMFKYGAINLDNGATVQVGIDAGRLAVLSNTLEYQTVVEHLSYDENFDYVRFIGTNHTILASGLENEIGENIDGMDGYSIVSESLQTGEMTKADFQNRKANVLDIAHPVYLGEELMGTLSVGLNTDTINSVVRGNTLGVLFFGLLVVLLISYVLYRASANAVNIIELFVTDMGMMANGDFTNDIPEEILMREDEFGSMSNASNRMKESIRDILRNVTNQSEVVAAHSEELTATSHQSALASDELASVIQEVAATSSSQANDVEHGTKAVHELERIINTNETHMETLNQSTDEASVLKDEGIELIHDLVDKTEETRGAIQEIGAVINDTNTSAANIVKAIEMIRNLSDQTNLLALNASIEAARAGEAGAGFAVVAEEIRKLAENSNNFTGEIEEIINDLTSKTSDAVHTMETVNEMIELQGDSVDRTDTKFEGIALSLEQIQNAIAVVNDSNHAIAEQEHQLRSLLENLAAVAEENAAGSEEASASVEEQNAVMTEISNASDELAEIAEELNNAVSIFTI